MPLLFRIHVSVCVQKIPLFCVLCGCVCRRMHTCAYLGGTCLYKHGTTACLYFVDIRWCVCQKLHLFHVYLCECIFYASVLCVRARDELGATHHLQTWPQNMPLLCRYSHVPKKTDLFCVNPCVQAHIMPLVSVCVCVCVCVASNFFSMCAWCLLLCM